MAETPIYMSAEDINISQNDLTEGRLGLEISAVRDVSSDDEDSNFNPWEGQTASSCQEELFSLEPNEDGQFMDEVPSQEVVTMNTDNVPEDMQYQEEDNGKDMKNSATTCHDIYEKGLSKCTHTEEECNDDEFEEYISDTDKIYETDHLDLSTKEDMNDMEITEVENEVNQDNVGQIKCTSDSNTVHDINIGCQGCNSHTYTLENECERDELTHIDVNSIEYLTVNDSDMEEHVNEIENMSSSRLINNVCNNYKHVIKNGNILVKESSDRLITDRSEPCPFNMNHQEGNILAEGDVNVVDVEFSRNIDIDTDQIWPPNWELTSTTDSWGESYLTDCQTHDFWIPEQNSAEQNVCWFSQTIDELDNNEHTLVISEHETQRSMSMNQTYSNYNEANKDVDSPQAMSFMGNSENPSIERSTSPRDNEANSSDLSEDEIANRRYGVLYKDIERDKEEVSLLPPVCSLV
ncbi:uncharacterized protein LOC142158543 [Mixophyes fleayi]|uniref:uncharacterized protein LOC142158543 n=1 Tax=Mixophyes fleayi TaxID=3061075 RepID=UPI003F4E410B